MRRGGLLGSKSEPSTPQSPQELSVTTTDRRCGASALASVFKRDASTRNSSIPWQGLPLMP
jgi:hypothetical protein